jgi:DNA-binding beta-propeller fold protein YncE
MCRENSKTINYLLVLLIFLASCVKDKPVKPGTNTPPVYTNAKNLYVVCEGSLGNGNSALTLYRPATDSVYDDVYFSANAQGMGDVFQSMTRIDNKLFLCVNNSDKILVVDRYTWKLLQTIPVSKPRYVVAINSTKAYVSSLYGNQLTIINPNSMEVTGTVTMPGQNPEGMLYYKEKLYVTLWDTGINKLYAVDPVTDLVSTVETLEGSAPKEVLADKEGKLWVLGGNIQKNKKATLTRIDPITRQKIAGYSFPTDADPLRLTLSSTGNQLYFIEVNYTGGNAYNGVYKMGVNDAALPTAALIQAQNLQYFWGLGIDPENGDIYVGDPKGFTQQGTVYIYSENGQLKKDFDCAVGPGHFYFDLQ